MLEPLVSAIIPCHNSAATIERALDSALSQTFSELEIIVVDDASTDATPSILRSRRANPRLRLIALDRNLGPAGARNRGVEAARGKYIAFLDSDDEWLPEKIALQFAAMEANRAATLCGCDAVWVYPDGSTEHSTASSTGQLAWKALLRSSFVQTPSVMAPRAVLEKLGGFNPALLVGEDQDLWIRLALAGEVIWVKKTLVRVHNLTSGFMHTHASRADQFLLPMLERHIATLKDKELGSKEARAILGERSARVGRNLYVTGSSWRGARLILHAAMLGYQPLANVAFLAHASPPGRCLKQLFQLFRSILVRPGK
jgi:glycosyltransferase involved in cell wall biosynthesis